MDSLADLEIVGRFVCSKRVDSFVGLKMLYMFVGLKIGDRSFGQMLAG